MYDKDRAWLSGFIDGEGHVGIHPTRDYYQACCFIRNTHLATMTHVQCLLEEILERPVKIGHETRVRGKDSYYVNVQSYYDLLKLGHAVHEFSVTKVRQWGLVIEYALSRASAAAHINPYTTRELQIVSEMSIVNKRWSDEA